MDGYDRRNAWPFPHNLGPTLLGKVGQEVASVCASFLRGQVSVVRGQLREATGTVAFVLGVNRTRGRYRPWTRVPFSKPYHALV